MAAKPNKGNGFWLIAMALPLEPCKYHIHEQVLVGAFIVGVRMALPSQKQGS